MSANTGNPAAAPAAPAAAADDFVSYGNDITSNPQYSYVMDYLNTIVTSDPITDAKQEEYLDLSGCGMFTDKNKIEKIDSRMDLWTEHPELEGRLVIFRCARPLFEKTLSAFENDAVATVLITGTPGVGKSSLRNIHAHLLFKRARSSNRRCSILMAKGGQDLVYRLHLSANGALHAETISAQQCMWVITDFRGFTLGTDLFVLGHISKGTPGFLETIGKGDSERGGGGLVLYSSPSYELENSQLMKQDATSLGYPLPSKPELLRYTSARMEELYEQFGGLVRIVWGTDASAKRHVLRLRNALQDVDGFLSVVNQRDVHKGPHRYFYMKLRNDAAGNQLYDIVKYPATVVPAPRYVVRQVAERIVQTLLEPSLEATLGKLHKAVNGILFEEVCLYLIEHHSDRIEIEVRNLNSRKRPLGGHVKSSKLEILNFNTRKDVDSGNVVASLDGSATPFLVVPKTSNFPGIDAVLALGQPVTRNGTRTPGACCCINMTRAFVHGVSDEGVAILTEIQNRMTVRGSAKHCLLFLVPEAHFKAFKKQDADTAANQASLDKIVQLVGCIRVSRGW